MFLRKRIWNLGKSAQDTCEAISV